MSNIWNTAFQDRQLRVSLLVSLISCSTVAPVPECHADLSECSSYFKRHKVCATHCRAPNLVIAGLLCRHGVVGAGADPHSCQLSTQSEAAMRAAPAGRTPGWQPDTDSGGSQSAAILARRRGPHRRSAAITGSKSSSSARASSSEASDGVDGAHRSGASSSLLGPAAGQGSLSRSVRLKLTSLQYAAASRQDALPSSPLRMAEGGNLQSIKAHFLQLLAAAKDTGLAPQVQALLVDDLALKLHTWLNLHTQAVAAGPGSAIAEAARLQELPHAQLELLLGPDISREFKLQLQMGLANSSRALPAGQQHLQQGIHTAGQGVATRFGPLMSQSWRPSPATAVLGPQGSQQFAQQAAGQTAAAYRAMFVPGQRMDPLENAAYECSQPQQAYTSSKAPQLLDKIYVRQRDRYLQVESVEVLSVEGRTGAVTVQVVVDAESLSCGLLLISAEHQLHPEAAHSGSSGEAPAASGPVLLSSPEALALLVTDWQELALELSVLDTLSTSAVACFQDSGTAASASKISYQQGLTVAQQLLLDIGLVLDYGVIQGAPPDTLEALARLECTASVMETARCLLRHAALAGWPCTAAAVGDVVLATGAPGISRFSDLMRWASSSSNCTLGYDSDSFIPDAGLAAVTDYFLKSAAPAAAEISVCDDSGNEATDPQDGQTALYEFDTSPATPSATSPATSCDSPLLAQLREISSKKQAQMDACWESPVIFEGLLVKLTCLLGYNCSQMGVVPAGALAFGQGCLLLLLGALGHICTVGV
eukprot:gene12864-12990_t